MVPQLFPLDLATPDAQPLLRALDEQSGAPLLAATSVPRRIFGLTSPWAPGVCFVGAEARLWPNGEADRTVNAGGVGLTLADALASCLGETVERLSQAEHASDVVLRASAAAVGTRLPQAVLDLVGVVAAQNGHDAGLVIDWVGGRQRGADVLVPADWVLRRRQGGPLQMAQTALSTGVAAGPTYEAARTRAILELVERDAIAHWWVGGRRGRPVALEAAGGAHDFIAAARGGVCGRTSWLLDVTTDLDVPCIVSLSVGGDGTGLACGMAARASMAAAARAAILEMCQMELALLVVALKRQEGGDGVLNAVDRQHLLRATAINANACDLLHPRGAPRSVDAAAATADDAAARVAATIEIASVDLTRPGYAVPVVAAVAPTLQRLPSAVRTERLVQTMATHGGGERWTGGVSLF